MLSNRLKALRKKNNLLQKDIADFLKITTSAYGFYEQGKREPDYDTLKKLANYFGVSIDYLLGSTDEISSSALIKLLKLAQGDRSLNDFSRHANVSPGNLSRIMKGQKPSPEILKKLAEKAHNGITYEDLMIAAGYISTELNKFTSDENNIILNKKDEKDIQKTLNNTLEKLEQGQDGLMFDGEPLDDETRELLKISLENSIRLAKQIAKKKFTPKKYRE